MTAHKHWRRTVAAIVAVGALAACSKGSATKQENSSSGETTVRYFTFSAAPDHLKDLDKIVQAFQTENPKIKVKVESAPYKDYFTKLQTAFAGGTTPDTFELDYENFISYSSAGSLLDLSATSAKDSSYQPSVYSADSLNAFQASGKQYAMPESFSTVVLLYNKKLFDAAGVAYPTAAWTWADEAAAAAKLTDKAKGTFGDFQPVSFYEFYKALDQAGGSFFNADKTKATFNSPEGVRAAKWLLGKPGSTMPTLAQIGGTPDYDTNLFKKDKLAMWHNGIWQFTGLKDKKDWDVVVEPGDSQKSSAVFQNAVAAANNTPHADAAWKWLKFLTSSDVMAQTRIAGAWELPPLADTNAIKGYLDQTPPTNRQAVFESLKAQALTPVIAKQQQMQDIVDKALQGAKTSSDLQKVLDDAAAKVNALLG
jgi:multiple sugar transport system substrate-binding protein